MLTYENSIHFAKDAPVPAVLRNFYAPEDSFVWSTSRWSEITFAFSGSPAKTKKFADFILDFDVFKTGENFEGQNVLIYVNGLRVGSHFIARRTTVVASIESTLLKPTENVLTFDTPDARNPTEFGISDNRVLGIQLFSLQVRPAG